MMASSSAHDFVDELECAEINGTCSLGGAAVEYGRIRSLIRHVVCGSWICAVFHHLHESHSTTELAAAAALQPPRLHRIIVA